MPVKKEVKAKKFFLKTNYPNFWTRKIRKLKYKEGYEDHSIDLLEVDMGARVLEVGTGEGRFIPKILKKKAIYVGVDLSNKMLKKAVDRISVFNKFDVNLLVADAENLPFRKDIFDRAFCFATIYFIPDKDKAIEEMSRVAKKALIEFRNVLSLRVLWSYLLHLILLNCQGVIRPFIEAIILRKILVKMYGQERVHRLRSYLLTYQLTQPFYPITPFGLNRLFRRVGMKISCVEGYDLPVDPSTRKHKRTYKIKSEKGRARWIKPVLLVKATRVDPAPMASQNASNMTRVRSIQNDKGQRNLSMDEKSKGRWLKTLIRVLRRVLP